MEKKFYSISEVSKIIGREPSTIRFWESKFNKLQPLKRAGGRRFYRIEDVNLLKDINDLLKNQKLTIEGAKKQLHAKSKKIERVVTDQMRDVILDLKRAEQILK